ncbi:hypothetical protein [uncultured Roseibium sp.]|uniref:hypothetical protein n=1 Tax=uncultured Roseibium sp. TaxID=1936171 RepID=UPI00262C10C9|nr:hypothetical protein [uncultured Roseibium sp.]
MCARPLELVGLLLVVVVLELLTLARAAFARLPRKPPLLEGPTEVLVWLADMLGTPLLARRLEAASLDDELDLLLEERDEPPPPEPLPPPPPP